MTTTRATTAKTSTKTPAKTAARKAPQDRKPKQDEAPAQVTITVDGFEVTLDADKLDDYDLMENIARVDDGERERVVLVLRSMLGPDVHEEVKAKFRGDDGRIRVEPMIMFFYEVMKQFQTELQARG
ncbi:hypothetical protein [Paeniglutamicibacter terrestris]|uniref:Tail assembly chaperone n=1 Tax=Paeniglutamicibacter terrestris TaxID=2723403 RepID=A0ABX1G4D8_9MICC|nr:hypothetical protein [Paeniglutamicibacter terrestris]NKG21111.1 hypothetical protein [Paeniglutamicibacter terrestris]